MLAQLVAQEHNWGSWSQISLSRTSRTRTVHGYVIIGGEISKALLCKPIGGKVDYSKHTCMHINTQLINKNDSKSNV